MKQSLFEQFIALEMRWKRRFLHAYEFLNKASFSMVIEHLGVALLTIVVTYGAKIFVNRVFA